MWHSRVLRGSDSSLSPPEEIPRWARGENPNCGRGPNTAAQLSNLLHSHGRVTIQPLRDQIVSALALLPVFAG
jgi:hypothetical protein